MVLEARNTQLGLDGRWNLEELSKTAKEYIQLYRFAYSLIPDIPDARREEIDYIYGKFPWRGGYSTVNFFTQIFHKIPSTHRPEIKQIQYGSPGFIELTEILAVAGIVAAIIKAVCSSINIAHDTYRNIQRASVDYKLSKINLARADLDLKKRQIEFCKSASQTLVEMFGLTDDQDKILDKKVQGNPIMKLKILLSVYRRVEPLAKKQIEGKLKVTGKEIKGIKKRR
jgi:hypothetical protein